MSNQNLRALTDKLNDTCRNALEGALSRQAESDCPLDTIGKSISISSREKYGEVKPFSLVFSQLRFP